MAQSRLKNSEDNTVGSRLLKKTRNAQKSPGKSKYLQHSGMLFIALIGAMVVAALITNFYPNQLADILIPQGYLLVLLPFFLTLTFLFGYIFLNIQKGFTVAWGVGILTLFQLQQISITPAVFTLVFGVCIGNILLITRLHRL